MRARGILASLTLEQRVGQVFMLGFDGTTLTANNRALIDGLHLGGVTLFGRNIQSPAQIARLTSDLQSVAEPVPLFISIDQEGGLIIRIQSGATLFPGAMALGATGDPDLAQQVAAAAAEELRAMGINMNLAPVVDVNTNPRNPVIGVRAFGSDPETVARFGAASIEGHQEVGVSAIAKHFPGHGDTAVDSHRDLPVVAHPREHLDTYELPPFRAAIEAGVDGIMTAHVYMPTIEPRENVPATLSHAALTGLLREEMGFEGLILTDALDMRAITRYRSAAEAAVQAFEAGADMLLIAGIENEDRERLAEGPRAMLEAVRSGRVSEERLDASVLRILEAKLRRGVAESPLAEVEPAPGLEVVGSAAHRAISRQAARQAITLVRGTPGALPLPRDARILVVQPSHATRSLAEEEGLPASLAAAIRAYAPRAEELRVSPNAAHAAADAAARASEADIVVLGTYDLWQSQSQQALARALVETGKPVVAVTLRSPYDGDAAPYLPTVLAAYGDRPVHLGAAAAALFGEIQPTGQLPVALR